MTSPDPWATISHPPIRATLRKRAARRIIERVGRMGDGTGYYVVHGDAGLGDEYDDYNVSGRGLDPRDYSCSCQTHGGGQYRRVCSHIVRAIMAEEEEPWDGAEGEDARAGGDTHAIEEAAGEPERENESKESVAEPRDKDPLADYETYNHATIIEAIGDRRLTPELVSSLTRKSPPLPDHYSTYRDHQAQAVLECIEAFESGTKVVFLSAPTGAGKTLIGETVGRFFGQRTYTCTTKSLQAQILRDFSYAKKLMGRSNYPTLDNPEVTTDACTKNHSEAACWTCGKTGRGHCAFCHPTMACPYAVAKRQAAAAPLSVLNTAYLLAETSSPRSAFLGRDLYIIDEADALEDQLMSFIQVEIGPRTRKRLNIGLPDLKGKSESWLAWVASEALPAAERYRDSLQSTLFTLQPDPKTMKELDAAEGLVGKLSWLLEPMGEEGEPNLSSGWVMDVQNQKSRWKKGGGDENSEVTIVFKPIHVRQFTRDVLWNKGPRWLLMSATLISPAQMAEDLALERDEWTVVEVPSSFPIERRPIVVQGVTKVIGKAGSPERNKALEEVVDAVDGIMERHPDERILVHTVSYEITRLLRENLHDHSRLHSYADSWQREKELERFLANPNGVMLAPSFERGVDLHGDDCRVIVIAKVPYPYLGDAQVAARANMGGSGRRWYAARTIRSICQMTGRGMRSEDDWCISYVLDSQFAKLYRENRSVFPTWWSDALIWDLNDPKSRRVLEPIYARAMD